MVDWSQLLPQFPKFVAMVSERKLFVLLRHLKSGQIEFLTTSYFISYYFILGASGGLLFIFGCGSHRDGAWSTTGL